MLVKVVGSKVDHFIGFFHRPVMIMNVFTHVCHHPLFESGTKVCEPSLYDIELLFESNK